MNHSAVKNDETIAVSSATSSFKNNAQNELERRPDKEIIRQPTQTIEQSFETISRINTSNSHQLSLSLKISIQEDGDFIKNVTSNNLVKSIESSESSMCSNDSKKSVIVNSKENTLKTPEVKTNTDTSCQEGVITLSQYDLPDIINNAVQYDSKRCRMPETDVEPVVDQVASLKNQNAPKSVLVQPNKISSLESQKNIARNDDNSKNCPKPKTKDSTFESEKPKSYKSDTHYLEKNTKESRIDKTPKAKMEVLNEADGSFRNTKQSDISSDQSNSDSGLGYNSASSRGTLEKSSNSVLFSPSSESPSSSLISTSDSGQQHQIKEKNSNNEGTTISKNLKSLLKEPGSRAKHSRRVTFDQTVIVFCEELDPGFITNESGSAFDPPSEYRDNSHPFEPPDDYRDDEDDASSDEEINVRDYDDVFERNNNVLCCDLDLEAEQRLKNIILAGGSSLGEDQILGLLKDDALLQAISLTVDELGGEDSFHFGSHRTSSMDEQMSDVEVEQNESSAIHMRESKDELEYSDSKKGSISRQEAGTQDNSDGQPKQAKAVTSILVTEKKPLIIEQNLEQPQHSDTSNENPKPSNFNNQPTEGAVREACIKDRPKESSKPRIQQNENKNNSLIQQNELKIDNEVPSEGTRGQNTSIRITPLINSMPKNIDEDPQRSDQKDNVTRQAVTIRQAIVEPMPVSRATVLANAASESPNQLEECKQCGKNATLINNSSCQNQLCLQNVSGKPGIPNNNATIIRIQSQPSSAQSNALIGKIVNTKCSSVINEHSHQIMVPSRYVVDKKSTCQLCRNIESEQNLANVNKAEVHTNIINSQHSHADIKYAQPTNEQCANAIISTQSQKLSKTQTEISDRGRTKHNVVPNVGQNIIIQQQAIRSCCDAARRYQVISYPAQIRPMNDIHGATGSRQVVYFVNQQANPGSAGSIPISRGHVVTNQTNVVQSHGYATTCTTANHSNQPDHKVQAIPRLQGATTIYCNDANCSLLKSSVRELDGNIVDLRSVAICGQSNVNPINHLHSNSQTNATKGAYIYNARLITNGKIGNTGSGHTLYSIQHPQIKPAAMRIGLEQNSNLKSHFPNAHEIRRLDGLNAPPLTHNTSIIRSHKNASSDIRELEALVIQDQRRIDRIRKRYSISSTEEADDPTFGFSKRPSVKVITKTTP